MDKNLFKAIFKRREPKLFSYIYEVPFPCNVPYSCTVHEIERNLFVTPVLSLNNNNGYGFYRVGEEDGEEEGVEDQVDDMFDSFIEELNDQEYALNRKTGVSITILRMAELYDEGNFVYVKSSKHLKEIYGILETFIAYKIKFYRGPNTGNGMENDTDLQLLDRFANSMVEVYKEDDAELYYYETRGKNSRGHLTSRPSTPKTTIHVLRSTNKVTPKVSLARLKELGLS